MSKHLAAALLALPLILQIFNNCFAQDADVIINIRSVSPPIAEIRGHYTQSSVNKNFSFLRDYAGFSNLADRLSDIHLEDKDGKPVAFKQFVPGEYVASADFARWSYKIDLTPQKRPTAAAHISWIGTDDGLLFLDDLLPIRSAKDCSSPTVNVRVANGWTVIGDDSSAVDCTSHKVYFLSQRARVSGFSEPVDLAISGKWGFLDLSASEFVHEIYYAYANLFDGEPPGKKHVYILPFPVTVSPGNWEADTRGDTVVILSSDTPFQSQSGQRLHEQLRHEMFHLWIPNGIYLKGRYDWFYEGFALYGSLKLAVARNRIRFEDYLDTLGRAMTVDAALSGRKSLIEASNLRASGNDTILYARGMLVAFMTDLTMLSRSRGRHDVTSLLRSIYQKYKDPRNEADGNQAVLAAIDDSEIERYVKNGELINWTSVLSTAGIERQDRTGSISLMVTAKPNGSQRKLLDKLGYNNWRNSSIGPK